MDILAKSREMLDALTTFPYYAVLPPTRDYASWQEASAIAFALTCIGARSDDLPSRLGATRVTVNPKASSVQDAVTRYSRTTVALEPHTDSSQQENPHSIVIFGMARPDDLGGETQMVIVDELLSTLNTDTIALLRRPIWPLGHQPKPILETDPSSGETRISYYRKQLERSLELGASLSEQQMKALSALDSAIINLSEMRSFRLEQGETLIINNHKVLHGRTALADGSQRLMMRYRLRANLAACTSVLESGKRSTTVIPERLMYAASRLEGQGRATQAQILKSYARRVNATATSESAPSMAEVENALGTRDFPRAQSLLEELAKEAGPNFDVSYFLSALATQRNEHAKAAALLANAATARPFIALSKDPKLLACRKSRYQQLILNDDSRSLRRNWGRQVMRE